VRRSTGAAARPRSRRRGAASVVAGPADAAGVRHAIHSRGSIIRACYERQLLAHESLSGSVRVRMTVARDGRVTRVIAPRMSSGMRPVADCIVRVIERIRFERGADESESTYEFPFVFEPRG
jgi:hypothetical protein